jgi:hypothetical protein
MTQCCAFHRVGSGCSAHPLAARTIRFQAHAKIGWTRTVSNHQGGYLTIPTTFVPKETQPRPGGALFESEPRRKDPSGLGANDGRIGGRFRH